MMSLPNFTEFQLSPRETVPQRFDKWITRLDNMFRAMEIVDPSRKEAMLLHYGGEEMCDIHGTLIIPPAVSNGPDLYMRTVQAFKSHFQPKKCIDHQVYKFRQETQRPDENVSQFYTRLCLLSKGCEFADANLEIRRQIIQGCRSQRLCRKAMESDLTLEQLLSNAQAIEIADARSAEIEKDLGGHQVKKIQSSQSRGGYQHQYGSRGRQQSRGRGHGRGQGRSSSSSARCWNCGKAFPHAGGVTSCPAYGQECHKCHKIGHFSKYCGQDRQVKQHRPSRGRGWPKSRGRVHEIQEQDKDTSGRNEDDYIFAVNHHDVAHVNNNVAHAYDHVDDVARTIDHDVAHVNVAHTIDDDVAHVNAHVNIAHAVDHIDVAHVCDHIVNAVHDVKDKPPKFKITFDESTSITMTADSAATCNLIDEKTYNQYLRHRQLELGRSNIKAYGGARISTIGYFTSTVECKEAKLTDVFFVVSGQSGCLLSVTASKKLGLIKVADHVCNAVDIDKYPSVFSGIGKLKNVEIDLHIDESIPPVAQRHRRIPFQQRKMVEKELDSLLASDVIERAEGPTPWVSPIVVVPKPKRPGEVRICVDMRQANQAILRERHPSPTIDDIAERLNGAKVFSKIDLRSGYHQLMLSERSRYITTFSTHVGLFRYKRLNFGISSASEVFQKAVEDVISGIDGSFNISDDIFIFGKGDKAFDDHDKALDEVLHRLDESGLTANLSKCEFRKPSMEFFGMLFSGDGIAPDPKKVEALVQMPAPANVGEVQSLLGMTNYLARFVPGYSTTTAPLRKLTEKGAEFHWGVEQQAAFDELKSVLSREPIVSFFDVEKETELIVDASPVGLGAVLVQYDKNDKKRKPYVVAYGSRALTPVEMRYKSQLEREALAVVWACEYFHVYIYGAPVKIVTDHQPLVTLYGNPGAKLPLRLERWGMRLLPYQPVVEYRRGRDNPSDYMSRHPLESEKSRQESLVAEEYINFVVSGSIPKAMTASEVIEATNMDPTLCAAKDLLLTGRWYMMETKYGQDPSVDYEALQSFSRINSEMSVTEDGLLMKGRKVVIPAQLQKRVVDLAHEGHQGLVKTKALLREKVWFPRIDNLVTKTVEECIACKSSYDPKPREPLVMTEMPTRKWSCLAADFYGPLPSGEYLLVVVDEYSRFPEVEIITSLSARTVIPVLDKLFASRGTPDKLKTDNGTPFQSAEFKQFADHLGFKHQKVTPYWPEANGTAERFMRNIGKVCKCAQAEGKPWKQELYKFLRNYRATPHSSTGVAPATILNGQSLKIKLPQLAEPDKDESLRKQDMAAKSKMKSYAEDRRNIRHSDISVGDKVLMKNVTHGKMVPKFQPDPFEVIETKGSMVVAQRGDEVKARNSSHFRKVQTDVNPLTIPSHTDLEPVTSQSPELPSVVSGPPVPDPPQAPTPKKNPVLETHSPPVRPSRVRKPPKHLCDFQVRLPSFNK